MGYLCKAMTNQRQLRLTAVSFKGGLKLPSAAFLATILLLACSVNATATRQSSRGAGHKPPSVNPLATADKAVEEGDGLRAKWEAESLRAAIRKYAAARLYFHAAKRPLREVEVLERLGRTHAILSDYHAAIDYYEKALQLAVDLPDRRTDVDILNRIGNAYLETVNAEKALSYCRQAQQISVRIGYRRGEGEALNSLGLAHYISGNVMLAQESFNQSLAIWKEVKYDEGLAYTLLNLGYLHGDLGNTEASLDFYGRALDVSRSVNDQLARALTLTAMGGAYALQGEKQRALKLHQQALALFRVIGNRGGEAVTLNGIGYLYDDLGREAEALKYYDSALRLYESVDNRSYAAITSGYIGRVHFSLGEKEKALEYYYRKLATSRAVQDRRMESYTLRDIGNVLSTIGEKDKALEYYEQALTMSREVLDRRGEAYIVNSIGSLYEKSGAESQALEYYLKALPLMQAVADRRGEVITLFNVARAERELGRFAEARASIEKSLDLIEHLRTKVAGASLRISYLETVYQHYEFYIDLLMRMHEQDKSAGYDGVALEASERARARTLLESLIGSHTDIRKGVDPDLLAEESRVRKQLNQKVEQQTRLLSAGPTPEQGAAIKKEVEALLSLYEEVESRVRDESPQYAALTQPRQLKLPYIKKELDEETLLLEYSLGKERSYGWAVTSTSMMSFELPGRAEIEAAARELYGLLTAGNARKKNESRAEQKARMAQSAAAYPAAAAKLSKILLEPVAPLLGRKRLAIVADGILQYIPFNALPEPVKADPGATPYEPLIVNHEVITLPSLSTLAVLRREVAGRPQADKAVAVIADPVFESDDPRVRNAKRKTFAPIPADSDRGAPARLAARDIGAYDGPVAFERLPFTLKEAEGIFTVVPEAKTKRAVGFDANLKTVLSPELRRYGIVHFATHGLLNNSHPELSGIVLSLVDKSGRPQDGFLSLNEIYNLDLPADLVVLSACQTGLGKDARGEGLIGLTRGFMYAGAPRVVASLWRIDDRAAAELMRYFYEEMFLQHSTPAAALRAAQIKMWRTGEWQFPYYWAAFVLEGEWH
ncbi:MAG: CHAT domain-containing tetratricopeptide repeat protein [Pyrinomonadaceae bacterium]